MKKKIIISITIFVLVFVALNINSANADVYVKVDANGNAIGGAIMCDAGTCGAGSEYSRLTLQEGERYVLQGTGHAGIGNNNPNTQVQVDLQTNEWTITRQVEVKPTEPVVINNQPVISYTTQTVEKFTPANSPGNSASAPIIVAPVVVPPTVDSTTATATTDTTTAVVEIITATALSIQSVPTISKLKATTIELSDVIWVIKNQINYIRKEIAKILYRTKGKK